MAVNNIVTNIPFECNDINEVKIVRDEKEANKLLANGWILMNAGVSHTDSSGYQAKPHFILAKKEK